MQTTITPAYVNQPKPGNRSGSIKDQTGQYWGCPPDLLGLFQKGVPVTIEYSTNAKNGNVYYNIESVPGQMPQHRPPAAQAPAAPPPVAPQTHPGVVEAARKNGDDNRTKFVSNVVGQAMGSGQFGITDIKGLTFAAAEAFDELGRRDTASAPF